MVNKRKNRKIKYKVYSLSEINELYLKHSSSRSVLMETCFEFKLPEIKYGVKLKNCSVCGDDHLTDKSGRKCLECKYLTRKEYNIKHKVNKYNSYKARCKKLGREFSLTKEDFKNLEHESCAYCGEKSETMTFDRIDSSKGYVKSNVCPCCLMCNKMKLNHNVNDFIIRCKKIANYN